MRMAASALSLWWALARTMAIPISAQHRLLMCGRARRGLSTPSSLYLEAAPLRDNLSMNRCRSGDISPKVDGPPLHSSKRSQSSRRGSIIIMSPQRVQPPQFCDAVPMHTVRSMSHSVQSQTVCESGPPVPVWSKGEGLEICEGVGVDDSEVWY